MIFLKVLFKRKNKHTLCCNPFLGPHTKKKKMKKNQKYIRKKNKKNNNNEKRSALKITRIWLRRFKNTKIEIWQYFVDWWEFCW